MVEVEWKHHLRTWGPLSVDRIFEGDNRVCVHIHNKAKGEAFLIPGPDGIQWQLRMYEENLKRILGDQNVEWTTLEKVKEFAASKANTDVIFRAGMEVLLDGEVSTCLS